MLAGGILLATSKLNELKGNVEKVQETSSDTGIHSNVCMCHYLYYMNSGCILDTHITLRDLVTI